MFKKIVATFKLIVSIWVCILVPLLVGIKLVKSSSIRDLGKCVDTFVHSEGIGISKYMTLQFENTIKEFENIMEETESADMGNAKSLKKTLKSLAARNKNIVSICVYDEKEKFLASSSNSSGVDLSGDRKVLKLKDEILYEIQQRNDGSIVVKYTAAKKFDNREDKGKKFFFELTVKWNNYEKYMQQLEVGSFPRMLFIVSPSCERYVSLNSLPKGMISDRNLAALGMHLTKTINDISLGLSNRNVESLDFRVFKDEIKMPKRMNGDEFFVVVATNDTAINTLSSDMFNTIPPVIFAIIVIWLLVCLVAARFYNKTKEQQEISDVVVNSTPLAIVIFKAEDGKIMKINLSATTLLRIEMESIETTNMWDLFIEDSDKKYITNAISSNINVLNYEVLVQSFGGGSFWSICSASSVEVEEEKYIVLAILDINRRKEIEKKLANNAALLEQQIAERTADLESKAKELEESNSQLASARLIADEANNAKSKFLTSMSNELKTPINAIIGYSEILEEEAIDRKDTVSADDLRKIIGSAKHLLSLINEILDLSNIEAGKTQLFFENIDIPSLIKDVEGVALPIVTKNENSLSLECPKNIGVVYSDSTKLRQCLLNLLSNAAKFTEFGRVTMRVSPIVKSGEDLIEFSVMDTGIGIESDRISTIFETFQEDSSKSSGAGLGLSLTKKYVECLGGTITAESEVGAGSKFIIRVPRTCKVTSNESIEVKNQKEGETIDEFAAEENDFGNESTETADSFTRKSDQNE
ncbi:MAG: PAS domain S-box protein [Holosporaceae bacterium]|jgi:PAS domain S-box-containing protein|nr:PAS domain S-box protein [Holosporaceae bacterium]